MAKTPMSQEHKQALAEGRAQGRAVRDYLDALEANKPKRGRKRTPETIRARMEKIEEELPLAKAVKRLELVQERMNLIAELETKEEATDISSLEDAFVANASDYGRRKGISYAAWREIGVDASVLKRAGITRAS